MIQASRCIDDLLEQLWKFTVNLTAQTWAPDLKSTFTLYCQVFHIQSGNSLSALNSFFLFIFKLSYLFVQVSYSYNYLKQEKVDGRMNELPPLPSPPIICHANLSGQKLTSRQHRSL